MLRNLWSSSSCCGVGPGGSQAGGLDRSGSWNLRVGAAPVGAQADIDEGKREGLTSSEKEELSRLRRENRVLRMERDLLSRAAAFFAQENVLPK